MVSYEKVRQTLKTTTLAIAIFNIIFAGLGLISLPGLFAIRSMIDSGNTDALQMTSQQIDVLKESVTGVAIAIVFIGIIANIVIAVFCFINLSRLKKEKLPTPLPYYIGIVLATASVIYTFIASTSMSGILLQIGFQAIFIFLFFFALQQIKTLSNQN